jgi:hypothetical protein
LNGIMLAQTTTRTLRLPAAIAAIAALCLLGLAPGPAAAQPTLVKMATLVPDGTSGTSC